MSEEPELIEALFAKLTRRPITKFSRGCRDVPNKDGVYVIYGRWEGEVFYVGRTIQAVLRRYPFVRGLRQRLSSHRPKYGHLIGFRFLVVPDPRERALLEALATGILCPVYLGTGDKGSPSSDTDPAAEAPQSKVPTTRPSVD